MNKPKLLFLTEADPLDKRSWSGIFYQMHTQLSKYFEITNAGPIPHLSGFWGWVFKRYAMVNNRIFKKYYDTGHSKLVGKLNLQNIKDKFNDDFKFIFAPVASREVSQIKNSKIPILYASDVTFDLMKKKYGLTNLYDFSEKEGDEVERMAIENSTYCLYSSKWAADSAISTYGANPKKVFIVPFGANILALPHYNFEKKCQFKTLEILFLGVNWIRKGGEIVLETYKMLKSKDIDVHLTVCGCIPPINLTDTDVTVIPFLNKNISEDLKKFENLLTKSHLMFVPSKEDCTPIVFCEAGAYGIPVITRDEGGISSMIENGVNGYCLPANATVQDYFDSIYKVVNDKELYKQLSQSSRKMYLEKLNWDKWGENVADIINKYLLERPKEAALAD